MFNDFFVVSTAVSSFNNAALCNPLFFGIGILMLPLLFFVYLYGNDFIKKIGLNIHTENKIGLFSALFLMLWLIMFGGNYAVIRDGISLLPILLSGVLFVLSTFVTKRIIELKYFEKIAHNRFRFLVLALLILMAGFSAMWTWFYVLLQISALICGMIVGSRLTCKISDRFWLSGLIGTVSVLILMQPEYFRFGQLGNLTFVHILSLLFVGFFAITSVVTKYMPAKSRIYNAAYVKLKWLVRILGVLAFILFVSTESVPVFVGMLGAIAVLEALTIFHSSRNFENLSKKSMGLMLVCFGLVIICPVISALGILYLIHETDNIKIADFAGLL